MDFTHPFESGPLSFAMAKPVARPSWLSFYHPLSGQVWAAVLASTLVVCVILVTTTRSEVYKTFHGRLAMGTVVLEMVGTLLGQGLYDRHSTRHSSHILVACWLIFGMVVGTGYRGSLIAFLTLPRQPLRPETVEQLVTAVERVTFESYGSSYKKYFSSSESKIFRTLGDMLQLGISTADGLTDSITMKTAHINSRHYLRLTIAQKFMNIDGTTTIYIGRERITPAILGWPVPHDAPYKSDLNLIIMRIMEAGLYKQWKKELIKEVAQASRVRKLEELRTQQQNQQNNATYTDSTGSMKLTITHIQGPLLLLMLGLTLASVTFLLDKLLVQSGQW